MLLFLLFFCVFIQNTHAMEPTAFTECEQIQVLLDEAAILNNQADTELKSISAKPKTRASAQRLLGVKNKILKAQEKQSLAQAALKIRKERIFNEKNTAPICDSCKAKEIAGRTTKE